MSIDFKKLIPSNMRNGRWGELMEAVQSTLETIKADKIDIIKTQFELENMTDAQIIDLGKFLGYDLVSRDGYTSTTDYLKKELLSIVPRILNRTTTVAYNSILNTYNLTGGVYPCIRTASQFLSPFLTWATSNELDEATIMDQDAPNYLYPLPSGGYAQQDPLYSGLPATFLDPDPGTIPSTLDENTVLSTITRHILVSYLFNYIESTDEFMSFNTAEAFYNDLWYNKRRTEVLHLEPKIVIETPSSGISRDTYTNYDETVSGFVNARHIKGSFVSGQVDYIEFGTGNYTTLSGVVIAGVVTSAFTLNITSCDIISRGSSVLKIRKKISDNSKIQTFSEFALMSNTSGCLYYAQFPEVNVSDKFFSNIYLDLTLV